MSISWYHFTTQFRSWSAERKSALYSTLKPSYLFCLKWFFKTVKKYKKFYKCRGTTWGKLFEIGSIFKALWREVRVTTKVVDPWRYAGIESITMCPFIFLIFCPMFSKLHVLRKFSKSELWLIPVRRNFGGEKKSIPALFVRWDSLSEIPSFIPVWRFGEKKCSIEIRKNCSIFELFFQLQFLNSG